MPTDDILTETDTSGGTVNDYVFFGGKRVARRDSSGTVHYYFSDHLGSTSLITDVNGTMSPQAESDFYPYGGEIVIVADSTNNHYKYTGKERDAETCGTMCLDNFGARYDSSSLGRFMTPDWDVKPVTVPYAKFGDPQTLNLYAYVENGPINAVDADGHAPWGMAGGADCTGNEDQCQKNRQQAAKEAREANAAQNNSSVNKKQLAKGGAKIVLGVGLIATVAFGDAPGGVAGALLVGSTAIGASATTVSGVTDVAGAATKTDVSQAQEGLDATGNLPALAVTAATGGNLKAGQTAGTIADAASLAVSPKDATKNVFTAVDAGRTTLGVGDMLKGASNSVGRAIERSVNNAVDDTEDWMRNIGWLPE